jgi:hypothetical protein
MAIVEDLSVFFADLGVACQAGAVSFTGLLDMPTDSLAMSGVPVLNNAYVLTARASDAAAAALAQGSALTVAGTGYVVREVLKVDDGALCHITLTKA